MKGLSGAANGDKRLGCALALLLAALLACGAELAPRVEGAGELPGVELETVRFQGYRAGELDVEVRARSAQLDPNTRWAELLNVRIELAASSPASSEDEARFGAGGGVSIRAERGRLELDSEDFVLQGRVEGSVGDGQSFQTEELRFDAAEQRLWTDRPVRLARGGMVLEGQGLELDLETQRLRVSQVRTTFEGER